MRSPTAAEIMKVQACTREVLCRVNTHRILLRDDAEHDRAIRIVLRKQEPQGVLRAKLPHFVRGPRNKASRCAYSGMNHSVTCLWDNLGMKATLHVRG
jgi:hypothetical protein